VETLQGEGWDISNKNQDSSVCAENHVKKKQQMKPLRNPPQKPAENKRPWDGEVRSETKE